MTDATPHLPEHPAVTMFTTSWCGFCFRLKAQMDRAGIAVREVDIEADDEAATFVGSVNNGNHTVPTLLFTDGSTLTNPSIGAVGAAPGGDRLDRGSPWADPTHRGSGRRTSAR